MDPIQIHRAQQTPRILVVDDEERNRRLIDALLIPLGYQMMLAGDGEEVLEKVAEIPPDVILLDVMMPKMDGFEVARRLNQMRTPKSYLLSW